MNLLTPDFQLPADGWFQALALGEFPNVLRARDPEDPSKIVSLPILQVCDASSADSIVADFAALAAQPNFVGLLIDRDHESDDPGRTTDAWGWVTAMQNRADGVWVQVRWTDLGEPAVRNGRFRFLSPVFDPARCERLGGNRLRPMAIAKFGLTNEPGIKSNAPLSNRELSETQTSPTRKESVMDYKASLLALLGLPPEATDEDIGKGCEGMKSTIENACGAMQEKEQLKNRVAELETWKTGRERLELEAAVEGDLQEFADRIVNRDAVKELLLANRADARKMLAALKPLPGSTEPLRNAANAKPPAPTDEQKLANRREQVVTETFKNRRCRTRAEAWELAAADPANKDLFKQ